MFHCCFKELRCSSVNLGLTYALFPSLQDKQQTPSKRVWEGIRKTQSPPSWIRKDLEAVVASPLEMQTVEWEKTSATIPLVGQEIMDLQTEV